MNGNPRRGPAVYGACRQLALINGGNKPGERDVECWRGRSVGWLSCCTCSVTTHCSVGQ